MIWMFVALFAFLLAGNYVIARNFLYPPAIFSCVWLLSLFGLALAGTLFYPVSIGALAVYWIGGLAFSVGGVLAMSANLRIRVSNPFSMDRRRRLHGVLDFFLMIVVLGFPFYLARATADVGLFDPLYFVTKRSLDVAGGEPYNPLGNLVVLAGFLSMAMHYENGSGAERRWRTYLAITMALAYVVLNGAKLGVVTLILTLMFISFIRVGRSNFVALGLILVALLSFFFFGLFVVNFAYANEIDLTALMLTALGYWLGGVVAFDSIFQNPQSIESAHYLFRAFLETANSLGANFYVPSIHFEYANVSPVISGFNTYTMYAAYYQDFGWSGVILGLGLLGFVLTWIYRVSMGRNPWAVMVYGMGMSGLLLSLHGEQFWLALNIYIKAGVFFYLVYFVFSRIRFNAP